MIDEIMDRHFELSMMQNIPDMKEYAMDWQRLGNRAAIAGLPAMAASCHSRAKHYAEYDGGEYIKIVEGCLAELFLVEAA